MDMYVISQHQFKAFPLFGPELLATHFSHILQNLSSFLAIYKSITKLFHVSHQSSHKYDCFLLWCLKHLLKVPLSDQVSHSSQIPFQTDFSHIAFFIILHLNSQENHKLYLRQKQDTRANSISFTLPLQPEVFPPQYFILFNFCWLGQVLGVTQQDLWHWLSHNCTVFEKLLSGQFNMSQHLQTTLFYSENWPAPTVSNTVYHLMGHNCTKHAACRALQTYFLFLSLFHWLVLFCLADESENFHLHLSWHCAPVYQMKRLWCVVAASNSGPRGHSKRLLELQGWSFKATVMHSCGWIWKVNTFTAMQHLS